MQEDAVAAARLFGAVDSLLDKTGGTLSPDSRQLHDRVVASVRARVGREIFEVAWAEGRSKGLEGALEFALDGNVDA